MLWLSLAIIAQILIGISGVLDKIILKRVVTHPLQYTFGLGIAGAFALVLLPFGFVLPSLPVLAIGFLTAAVFFTALYFGFKALDIAEASEVWPAIGGLSPIFTLLFSLLFVPARLVAGELAAFAILTAGSLLFSYRFLVLRYALVASALFGLSNALHKLIFENSANFVSGLVIIQVGLALVSALLLLAPHLRRDIFSKRGLLHPKNLAFYYLNRLIGAAGAVLISAAIFLHHPAPVDAVSGVRYSVIFLAALIMARIFPKKVRETFRGRSLLAKISGTILVTAGVFVLAAASYLSDRPVDPRRKIDWGANFSAVFSEELGLNWKENYLALLDDLKIRRLRIPAYWNRIEPENNRFAFSDLDFQLDEAAQRGAKVILAVGQKLPRWPECHIPNWIRKNPNDKIQMTNELLEYIETVVKKYKKHPAVEMWQVENEPFFVFGECPELDETLLQGEIALVKSLDPDTPVMITDSGEFGRWSRAAKLADRLGVTMYRDVYHEKFGQISYPIPPIYFRLRSALVKPFAIVELQAEPWGSKPLPYLAKENHLKLFPPERFRENIEYGRLTAFDRYYLWGAEWWYFIKEKGHPEYWSIAKELFSQSR